MALDHRILKIILKKLDLEFSDPSTDLARLRWVFSLATYLVICFLGSLRGNERLMVELGGLIHHIYDGTEKTEEHPHVVTLLLGRFKNINGERWHLLLCSSSTASGFKPIVWVKRLLTLLLKEGKTSGPVFCDEEGELFASGAMNNLFTNELLKVKKEREDLHLCDSDQVWELYNIGRSLRRGSQTRAT